MKRFMLFLSTFAIASSLSIVANAATMDEEVVVASRLIHTVRAGAGGLSIQDRVARINERLNALMAVEPLAPSNIHIRMVGSDPGIYVGRHLVTTVTQADAQANNTTQHALARRWLAAYRAVLPQARPGQNWGVKG